MLLTWFVTNTYQASFLISLCGISWTIAMWAPYSLLGEFIITNESRTLRSAERHNNEYDLVETGNTFEGGDNDSEDNDENLRRASNEETVSGLSGLPLMDSHANTSTNSEAGVLLGIHNIYVVLPQFLVTFFSSIVFAILEPGGASGDKNITRQHHPHNKNLDADSIGFVLRFGGLMAIFAGILSVKLWK